MKELFDNPASMLDCKMTKKQIKKERARLKKISRIKNQIDYYAGFGIYRRRKVKKLQNKMKKL